MKSDWQSWAALLVILVTAAIMIYRLVARKKTGCGSGDCCAGGNVLKNKKGFLK